MFRSVNPQVSPAVQPCCAVGLSPSHFVAHACTASANFAKHLLLRQVTLYCLTYDVSLHAPVNTHYVVHAIAYSPG